MGDQQRLFDERPTCESRRRLPVTHFRATVGGCEYDGCNTACAWNVRSTSRLTDRPAAVTCRACLRWLAEHAQVANQCAGGGA